MTTSNLTQIDTISARMQQAGGVLAMLADAGQGDDFGTLTHQTVMRSLWAVQDLIEQARVASGSINKAA